jgi:hypothetical protein
MSVSQTSCHGTFECLEACSRRWRPSRVFRLYQKLHSYWTWHVENRGLSAALRQAFVLPLRYCGLSRSKPIKPPHDAVLPYGPETLGLKPGELVQVRPVEEILATLDSHRRHKGLLWMTGMQKYCGRQLRVYRRVETIMLESDGQLRKMRNTVLLEGATCDGVAFGACDRSCFHFWREIWLRRVEEAR